MGNDLVPRPESRLGLRKRFERGKENRTKIAGHISRLMSHYWTANEDPRLRKAQAEDWLEDLAEFHEGIVGEACRDWRQEQTRRPTPADVRQLCLAATDPYEPPAPRHVPSTPETPAQVAARIAKRQRVGEKFGELAQMLRGEKPWPFQ